MINTRSTGQILSQIKATQKSCEAAANRRLAKLRGRKEQEETLESFPDFPHYMLAWKIRQEKRGFRVVPVPAEEYGGEKALKVVSRDSDYIRTVADFKKEYDRKVESMKARGITPSTAGISAC